MGVGSRFIGGSGSATTIRVGANKLVHIFGKEAHKLGGLLQRFRTQEAAYLAVERATQAAVVAGGITGKFEISVKVVGFNVTVRGVAIDGIARIGTFFIK